MEKIESYKCALSVASTGTHGHFPLCFGVQNIYYRTSHIHKYAGTGKSYVQWYVGDSGEANKERLSNQANQSDQLKSEFINHVDNL